MLNFFVFQGTHTGKKRQGQERNKTNFKCVFVTHVYNIMKTCLKDKVDVGSEQWFIEIVQDSC